MPTAVGLPPPNYTTLWHYHMLRIQEFRLENHLAIVLASCSFDLLCLRVLSLLFFSLVRECNLDPSCCILLSLIPVQTLLARAVHSFLKLIICYFNI